LLFIYQSIPGPGQYTIKRELDPESPKGDIIGLEFERPPFGSQTKVIFSLLKISQVFFFFLAI